jgi:hypothetical protein
MSNVMLISGSPGNDGKSGRSGKLYAGKLHINPRSLASLFAYP